jgi:hypothetical protein
MKKTWIFSTQCTTLVFAGVASVFFWCGPTSPDQDVYASQDDPAPVIVATTDQTVIVADNLQRAIRFQKLAAEWRAQRGVTSSIEQMCTRPAYLSIIAMGPDVLPLIITQLRSEGNDPDHWFVALHHITQGVDPAPDSDRGDMAKMAEAWLKWAENAG